MVNVDEAVIARYSKEGKNFEILVDCDKALEIKEGKELNLDEVLATFEIYSDVMQGEKADNQDMAKVFGSHQPEEVAKQIIKKGDIQITAEHKRKLKEEKKKKIINFIHKNAIDPKTNRPHPPQRIEILMEEARVKVDEFKPAESQVHEIVKELMPFIPIKLEVWEVAVKLPPSVAAKSYHMLKEYGKLLKDQWQNDGSLVAVVELPAGMYQDLEDEVNKLTQGEAELKILNKR